MFRNPCEYQEMTLFCISFHNHGLSRMSQPGMSLLCFNLCKLEIGVSVGLRLNFFYHVPLQFVRSTNSPRNSRGEFPRDGREAHVHGYGVHLGGNSLVMDAKLTSVFSDSEMRCALWSLPWFRICWGVVGASRNYSGFQGRYRLPVARNSHLAASRSDPDVCARSPLIGRAFPAEPRTYPPRQST
jgi:hypothetical protein